VRDQADDNATDDTPTGGFSPTTPNPQNPGSSMSDERGPQALRNVLSELVALRGYARREGARELQQVWARAAGETVASQTRALDVKRGVLQVAVASSVLLSELVGFYRTQLVTRLKAQSPELRIKDVKFRLDAAAARRGVDED